MIRVKAVIGACVLCAVAFSAVAVQGASAAGTTGFTCVEAKEPGAGFADAHCKEAVGSGAKFEHVAIPENLVTEGTTNGGLAKLKSVQSGVTLELQATETVGVAEGKNTTDGTEHFIEGTGVVTYKGVTVTAPAGKGCIVRGGEIVTNKLYGTSKGQGMEGLLTPFSGETFAEFTIEGCSIGALNHVYTVKGSVRCPNTGATVNCTHAQTTAQGTLALSGQKAGVELSTTAATLGGLPLAATTVP